MTPETRLKKVHHFIERMPGLSTTVAKVLEICNTPTASANDINRVISYDPVLTGQLLKLINSAYYGFPNRVTSLTRAIIILGINTVKNMVLANSVLAGCKSMRGSRQMNITDFWTHSLCVGVLAKMIAVSGNITAGEKEEYFISGLLHDLGKLPMMTCFPQIYSKALNAANQERMPIIDAENKHIGFNHCQVGLLIAAKWRLGAAIKSAISGHHGTPNNSDTNNVFLMRVSFADQLANLFTNAPENEANMTTIYEEAPQIGITLSLIKDLKSKMETEIEKAKVFLQIAVS